MQIELGEDDHPFRTIVAAPAGADTPAVRALHMEGIRPSVATLEDSCDYGQLLASLWAAGEGFILLEADVVPWPGALADLWACRAPWCGRLYPVAPSGPADGGLGCVAFKDVLVREFPRLPERWDGWGWKGLDLRVRAAVTNAVGSRSRQGFHVHRPPVAHARERAD